MVKQSWVSTRERSSTPDQAACCRRPGLPGLLRSPRRARCRACSWAGSRWPAAVARRCHGLFGMVQRVSDIGQHHGCRAIGDQGTIGALQGAGHKRVLFRDLAAELVAQILAQLGIGVGDAVLVVLGGDRGERVGLVPVALEVLLGDAGERPRRSRPRCRFPPSGRRPSAARRRSRARAWSVIFSTPTTRTKRARLASMDFRPGAPPLSRWRRRSRPGLPA